MKEGILRLRSEGKTYREIVEILGCAISTVAYHCGEGQKEKSKKRKSESLRIRVLSQRIWRFKDRSFKVKSRDFQRRDGSSLMNRSEKNFNIDELLRKIGDNPVCYLSGEKIDLTKTKSYHFDHITPASKGGGNDLDNLGLLTDSVNKMKHDMSVDEFLLMCSKILRYNGYIVRKK
jgi:5-methylcytosine-specific restriction endonuclease McrA